MEQKRERDRSEKGDDEGEDGPRVVTAAQIEELQQKLNSTLPAFIVIEYIKKGSSK